jgi:hypothetical protein
MVGTSCYVPMRAGERWLILGGIVKTTGVVMTGTCSGSREIPAGNTLFERMVKAYTTGPNLFFGQVRSYKGWDSAWRTDNLLAGVEVRLEGEQKQWSAITSHDGQFEVSGLPAGTYNVRATAPGLSTGTQEPDGGSHAGDKGLPPRLDIPQQGCVELQLMMWPDQHIAGTVREASGKSVSGVLVRAHKLNKDGRFQSEREAATDENGLYILPRLTSGTYIVGVNAGGPADNEPYRMTFHPAAHSVAAARKILVNGNGADNIDLTLDPPRKAVDFKVRVLFGDGKPAAGAIVIVERDDKGKIWIPGDLPIILTNRSGTAVLRLFHGDEYVFSATWTNWPKNTRPEDAIQYRSKKVRQIATADGMATITLNAQPERDPLR